MPVENNVKVLRESWIHTPLGPMLVIADETGLYLLEFVECRGLEREVERLRQKTQTEIITGCTSPINAIKTELQQYFEGNLKALNTPFFLLGTPFQNQVWEELKNIPYGETSSYSDIATAVGRPSAFRAVAQAIGANQLALIIPCHRVINANGNLGGYAGGIERKKWLLNHEQR